jgi:hypothetical protein
MQAAKEGLVMFLKRISPAVVKEPNLVSCHKRSSLHDLALWAML